jgi:hypothetical protein
MKAFSGRVVPKAMVGLKHNAQRKIIMRQKEMQAIQAWQYRKMKRAL